ncbi:MAG TPA: WecB/TagA/CpsF family glycosyltransferase [Williamwhitmania sp.]|nr:WecB/TagA/CpsF family glycosyltransferase [Williamwhitmania sp.]
MIFCDLPSVNFFGLKISVFSEEELIFSIEQGMVNNTPAKIYYGYSLAVLSYLKKYPSYHKTAQKFDVMVTDGRLFYLLAKLFGFKLKYDISIPMLTLLAIDIAANSGSKIMLVGGTSESNAQANANLKINHPNINVLAGIDGFYDRAQEVEIIAKIVDSKPNLLLLGLPTPEKQLLATKLRPLLNGCVIIPCGGMIDVLAGKEKLTPHWLKKIGLASIYRHIQHPKRIPELILILFRTLKVSSVIFYLKFIRRSENIDIPSIVCGNNSTSE